MFFYFEILNIKILSAILELEPNYKWHVTSHVINYEVEFPF